MWRMGEETKTKLKWLTLWTFATLSLSFGVSGLIAGLSFVKALTIISPIVVIFLGYLYIKDETSNDAQKTIQDLTETVTEQTRVIDEYEKIFDAQLVELPCVCGGNTFEGLFSPKLENIVTCQKCNNNYRVDVSYNSVLLSEPLNVEQTFDELIGRNTSN